MYVKYFFVIMFGLFASTSFADSNHHDNSHNKKDHLQHRSSATDHHRQEKKHHQHHKKKHHHQNKKHHKIITALGVIHHINQSNHSVNLTHEPIPALNWPEMTMDMAVSHDIDLKSLKAGDKIKFHIKLGKDKVYRIVKIIKRDHRNNHKHH